MSPPMLKPGGRFHFAVSYFQIHFSLADLDREHSSVFSKCQTAADIRVHLTFLCVSLNFLPLYILLDFDKGKEMAKPNLLGLGVKCE